MNWEYVMLDTLVEMAIQQEEEAQNEIAEGDGSNHYFIHNQSICRTIIEIQLKILKPSN